MTETESLFTQILNCSRVDLYLNRRNPLDNDKSVLISSVLRKRMQGEPLEYILGRSEFMGYEFVVNKDVLIPRPETEILVEAVIKKVRELAGLRVSGLKILELGTGSGCIAVSLAKLLNDVSVTATDISSAALKVARQNAELNSVKINFLQSDIFSSYELRATSYELIISNPPYIATSEIDELQPEVRHEPRVALDGGKDGLDFYRRIAVEAPNYLKTAGYLILEMGFNQAGGISNILKNSYNFEIIEIIKDYSNIDRVIVARKI